MKLNAKKKGVDSIDRNNCNKHKAQGKRNIQK